MGMTMRMLVVVIVIMMRMVFFFVVVVDHPTVLSIFRRDGAHRYSGTYQ